MASPLATIAIISIGEMGLGIARLLIAHNYAVITNISDRSPATQSRAQSASIECLSSDVELVAKADYILSIVPPRDAIATAKRITHVLQSQNDVRAGKPTPLYYLDLNAISPCTARQIGELFAQDAPSVRLVDGGIIGGPPTRPAQDTSAWKRPGVPLSGPHALDEAPVSGPHLASTLNTQFLSPAIGTASGLKCAFASLSKGFIALALQSYSTADALGVLPQLQSYIAQYNPSAKDRAEKGITGCPKKAYRWVEEMRQIGECFAQEGGWADEANMFRGVAGVYEGLADVVERRGGTEGMGELEGALEALVRGMKSE